MLYRLGHRVLLPPRGEAEEGAVLGRGAAVGIVLCKMGTAGAACTPGGRSEFLL